MDEETKILIEKQNEIIEGHILRTQERVIRILDLVERMVTKNETLLLPYAKGNSEQLATIITELKAMEDRIKIEIRLKAGQKV